MELVSIQTHVPTNLDQFVKSFWYIEVSDQCGPFYEEEIIPDGHHEIIFHLNRTNATRKMTDDAWRREPDAFLAGQTLKSYGLRMLPGSRLYGIRFYPHTLPMLFGFPASELTNNVLDLPDVAYAESFWNCIVSDPRITFKNFEKLLTEKLSRLTFAAGNAYTDYSVSEILRTNGKVSVDHLIQKTGISGRYLDQLFERYVGLAPKTLGAIVKLNNFISYRQNHPEKTLTECCYQSDYYDQSHLIRSFQKFIGKSPRAYFGESGRINEVFPSL